MKKILFLLFLGILLFSCEKNTQNNDELVICMNPPSVLHIFIVKENSEISEIIEKSSGIPKLLENFHESKEKIRFTPQCLIWFVTLPV